MLSRRRIIVSVKLAQQIPYLVSRKYVGAFFFRRDHIALGNDVEKIVYLQASVDELIFYPLYLAHICFDLRVYLALYLCDAGLLARQFAHH